MKVEQGQNIFLNFPFSNGSGAGGRVAGWQEPNTSVSADTIPADTIAICRSAEHKQSAAVAFRHDSSASDTVPVTAFFVIVTSLPAAL